MSDRVDDLIHEIAVKHGIAISRDDPILVLQTINNRLMQESSEAQQAQLDRFREEIEVISQRWMENANEKADRIITTSLALSRKAQDHAMREGAEYTASVVSDVMSTFLAQIQKETRRSFRSSLICIASAVFVAISTAVSVYFSH